jgi:hypothetical protein
MEEGASTVNHDRTREKERGEGGDDQHSIVNGGVCGIER